MQNQHQQLRTMTFHSKDNYNRTGYNTCPKSLYNKYKIKNELDKIEINNNGKDFVYKLQNKKLIDRIRNGR